MAISPVSNNQKGFTFAGESSKTYGVYITDGAFYDAPDRDGEMIEIPGRNGAYFLDKGRFKNIEVVYKAAMGAANETDFRDGIAAVRSWLCSKKGYQRLEDEFNPDEYRLAVFKDGAEVKNVDQKTGEFDITFECQPQRFLKSGETAVSVASGGTITNPTLFEASPLLETEGTGTINLNDDVITINNNPIGMVTLAVENTSSTDDLQRTVDTSMLATGDPITIQAGTYYSIGCHSKSASVTDVNNLSMTGDLAGNVVYVINNAHFFNINATLDAIDFTLGTAATYTNTITFTATLVSSGGTTSTATGTYTITMSYDGTNTFSFIVRLSTQGVSTSLEGYRRKAIVGDSSVVPITGAMWFDLDIGEAWTEIGGTVVSVNNSVSFGADLPTLQSGANEITYDNTLSYLKITPRWWEV